MTHSKIHFPNAIHNFRYCCTRLKFINGLTGLGQGPARSQLVFCPFCPPRVRSIPEPWQGPQRDAEQGGAPGIRDRHPHTRLRGQGVSGLTTRHFFTFFKPFFKIPGRRTIVLDASFYDFVLCLKARKQTIWPFLNFYYIKFEKFYQQKFSH